MSDNDVKVDSEEKLDLGEIVTLEPERQVSTNAGSLTSSTLNDAGTNGNGSDSSEAELLLANEEEQEIDLRFLQRQATERAETSDASRVAVQQLAKSALTTRESSAEDALKADGAEEFIPCRRTSMLTNDETELNRTDTELEEVSAETLEANERRKREFLLGATAVAGVLLLLAGGYAVRRTLSR